MKLTIEYLNQKGGSGNENLDKGSFGKAEETRREEELKALTKNAAAVKQKLTEFLQDKEINKDDYLFINAIKNVI